MKYILSIFLLLALIVPNVSFASIANESNPNVSVIELGSITANGDVYGLYLPKKSKVLGVYVVDTTGIVASDSNYVQVSLQNGSTVIAELDSRAAHENGLAALTPKAANIVSAASVVAAGSYLKATYAETGTVGMTTAKLFVMWYPL